MTSPLPLTDMHGTTERGLQVQQRAFNQLIPVLDRAKADPSGCGLYALTSTSSGEGVSYVTRELAQTLARYPGRRVLHTSAAVLSTLLPQHIMPGSTLLQKSHSGVWLAGTTPGTGLPSGVGLSLALQTALHNYFDYVLIECRALEASPEILRIASQVDGVLLVVATGSVKAEVQRSQRILEIASERVLGCILNQRRSREADAQSKQS